jgi:hypothetical protein
LGLTDNGEKQTRILFVRAAPFFFSNFVKPASFFHGRPANKMDARRMRGAFRNRSFDEAWKQLSEAQRRAVTTLCAKNSDALLAPSTVSRPETRAVT